MLRWTILGLLRGGDRIHGYALWKAYERRSGHVIQNGKFYRVLKMLVEARLIQPMASAEGDDPRRMPYEITAGGRAAFDQWMTCVDTPGEHGPDELAARALFIFDLPPDVAATFFAGQDHALSTRWKGVEHERERVLSRPGTSDRDRLVHSLLLARDLGRTAADLTWLREARAAYDKLHPGSQPEGVPAPRSRVARTRP